MNYLKTEPDAFGYKLEIVRLMPTVCIGPSLLSANTSSIEAIAKLITGEFPGVPKFMLPYVDVRDVAEAHIIAMKKDNINGMRFLISQQSYWLKETAEIFAAEFRPLGFKVPTRGIPTFVLKIVALFDSQVRLMSVFNGQECYADNLLSRKYLGLKYPRLLRKSMLEMGHSLIEKGIIKPN